jgi:hypothetical protein
MSKCDCDDCQRRQLIRALEDQQRSEAQRPVMPPTDTEMLDYIEETLCISRDSIRNAMKSRQWSRT